MTTYSFRVLRIIDQYNPITDDFDTLDAQTLDGSISLIGDTNFIPYTPFFGSQDDDGLEVEVDGSVVGSLIVDGQIIDAEDASTSLISFTWVDNGVQRSTTILAVNFEDPFSGVETAYAFVVGGTPLPEITSAAMFDAFNESITTFGLPLLHNPGPGDTIDMSAIPGVTTSENDYILVREDPFSTVFIPGGAGSDTIDFSDSFGSYVYLDYANVAGPVTVSIDGLTSTGSIVKQGIEIDSFEALSNQLDSGWFTISGGLAIAGTAANDTFTVALDEQWIELVGGSGNDTFNLDLTNNGIVRLTYNYWNGQGPTSGIVVDLNTGIVSNDGFGGTDQINITPGSGRIEIQATGRADNILGTAANERFILLGGDDTLDGGGGVDMVRYDRNGMSGVDINLSTGIGTGTYFGTAFTHTLSNIEQIRGSRNGNDTLTGNAADNLIIAYGGDDILRGGAGNDAIFGGSGFDTVIINTILRVLRKPNLMA